MKVKREVVMDAVKPDGSGLKFAFNQLKTYGEKNNDFAKISVSIDASKTFGKNESRRMEQSKVLFESKLVIIESSISVNQSIINFRSN